MDHNKHLLEVPGAVKIVVSAVAQTNNRPHLKALTSLRFFAAAMIVVHHGINKFNLPVSLENLSLDLAVSFFFVLSGFILTFVHPKINLSDFINFYRARIARCYPMHILSFLLFALIIRNGNGFDENGFIQLSTALPQIFLVQAWSKNPAVFFSYNTPSWSVSVEFFFYLLFPIMQFWRNRDRWNLKLISMLLISAIIACICHQRCMFTQNHNFAVWVEYINPLSHLFEFVVGIAAAAIFLKLSKFDKPAISSVAQTASIACTLFVFSEITNIRLLFPFFPVQIAYALAFAFVIITFAFRTGFLTRPLSNSFMVKLGDISFDIYMLHSALNAGFRPFWATFTHTYGIWSFIAYFVSLCILSLICHQFFEKPMRNLLVGRG